MVKNEYTGASLEVWLATWPLTVSITVREDRRRRFLYSARDDRVEISLVVEDLLRTLVSLHKKIPKGRRECLSRGLGRGLVLNAEYFRY